MTEHRPRDNERHVQLGVSHPTDDPARHRVFEIRATYSAETGGWVARLGEQNANEQFQGWGARLTSDGKDRVFATAAACLGDAVTTIVTMVDAEASDPRA